GDFPGSSGNLAGNGGGLAGHGNGNGDGNGHLAPWLQNGNNDFSGQPNTSLAGGAQNDPSWVVRTALCVEPRNGVIHIFMPPLDRLEDYLELVTAIEETAAEFKTPVVIEGYEPPHDHRIKHFKVTPDPGVIEVNVHPAENWDELVAITSG